MALYARLENGAIVERRDLSDHPPAHKAAIWRPIVDSGPPDCHEGEIVSRTETVSGDQVVIGYSVSRRPDAELIRLIKNEAQQRIIDATGASDLSSCMVKQLNAIMRATELANKRAQGLALTEAETAEAAALQAFADKIKAIRRKSEAVEAAMHSDFDNDRHW